MPGTRVGRAAAGRLAAVCLALFLIGACATGEPSGGAGSPSPSPPPPRALPIYYVAETGAGFRLYREFHPVPERDDPGTDAVREMLASPAGIDPDYRSFWPPGTALNSPVRREGGVITVDVSDQALAANLGAELAERTVQQLVYTVQGALASTEPVLILVSGRPVPELWGHVATAEPLPRADPYQTRSLVQIDDPTHGARLGRTVQVRGEAATFEANVPWQLSRDGAVVRTGFATATEGQRFAPFGFSLTLEPGDYVLTVTEDDPSGGEGRPPFTDTKSFTVS
jgi:hypothetical protein